MRIIAGKHRGHTLVANEGDTTRPITDRAKQSLFDTLQECYLDQTVLDCFSGSGSMGLEALSRGAAKAIFIERDRGALRALKQNLKDMEMTDKALILPIDAYESFKQPDVQTGWDAVKAGEEFGGLTIAFVDPPYSHADTGHLRNKVDALIAGLAKSCMIDEGIISFRHPSNISVEPDALKVRIVREFQYGDMAITWLKKAATA